MTGDFDEMDLEFDIIDRNDNTPVFITGSTSITVPPSDYVKQLSKKEWTKCRGLTHNFFIDFLEILNICVNPNSS